MGNFKDSLDKIRKYFNNPKNIEDFENEMKQIEKEPWFNHLTCKNRTCKYNMPKENVNMGTITYCEKYSNKVKDNVCNKRDYFVIG